LLSTGGLAQNPPAKMYAGKIFDSAGRQPLPFVTIHVMKPDGKPVKTVLSDTTGSFAVSLDTGKYFLLYTCAGYKSFRSAEIIVTDALQIADAFLVRDVGQLAAVTVMGRRPVLEPSTDGFVYNAEHDVAIAAGSAVDVLRKLPMVSIGPDGSPTIRGSNNIRVFIDNKPSSVYASSVADALLQVPSEEIARVEVITHPSAKYDAEGTDAVINIITKKNRYNGFNGMVRGFLGDWQRDANITLKLRRGYWITNLDAGLSHNDNESGAELWRSASKQETANRLQQQRESNSKQHAEYASLNFIRIIDTLQTLSFSYRFRNMGFFNNIDQHTQLYAADTIQTAFTRYTPSTVTNRVHTFTAGYNGQSRDKRKEFNFLAAGFMHSGDDGYDLVQTRQEAVDYRERNYSQTKNRDLMLQADLTQKISHNGKFETGIKTSWRTTTSESIVDIYNTSFDKYVKDDIRSNLFNYRNGIYAAYATYGLTIKSWQLRGGLRYEKTIMDASFKDTSLRIPDFNNLLPNLLVKKSLNDRTALTYSYTSRIIRPYIFFMNPNINYADSLNITYGNPNLLPEIVQNHTLEFSYNKRSIFTSISLLYSHRRRGIEDWRILRPDNIVENTFRNIGQASTWGLSTSFRYNSNTFSAGTTVLLRYFTLSSAALNLTTSGMAAQIDFNATYRLKKGFSLESFVYIESRGITLQQTRSYYLFYNLLVSKKLLKDKLNITLRMDGLLDRWFYRVNEVNTPTLFQSNNTRSINRYLRIAFSWKFGKPDIRTPVSRTIENND
jgi:hypothetical protein